MRQGRKLGYLAKCGTPYCGAIYGYFCVRCKHYVEDCRCEPGRCECGDERGWADAGERHAIRAALARATAAEGD